MVWRYRIAVRDNMFEVQIKMGGFLGIIDTWSPFLIFDRYTDARQCCEENLKRDKEKRNYKKQKVTRIMEYFNP